MNYLYLLINLAAVAVPLLFSFHPRLRFYKNWRQVTVAIFLTAFVFVLWDIYFTYRGVWGFNPAYLSGAYIFNLPIEELLFFICIPYACVFTYHCLNILVKRNIFRANENAITVFLIGFLLIVGSLFFDKIYTAVSFLSLAVLIGILKYFLKVRWLDRFYFSYLVLLLPFALVNGVLTGSGLQNPIVWYDNGENMGFRLLTIPFEDVFYGMLLVLLNISFYEYFLSKRRI